MKMLSGLRRKTTIVAVGLTTLALAGTAMAIPTFQGGAALVRNNTQGTSFVNLSLSATSYCFLTQVGVTETDTGAETVDCRLTRGPNVWTLEAILGTSSDADVRCAAVCYSTN